LRYRSILVTGTDTGVGKTFVTCAFLAELRSRGYRVGVFKPAETGCEAAAGGTLLPQDASWLKFFSESPFELSEICPYALPEPLAPMLAAERSGVRIDLELLSASFRRIEEASDTTLVEGAGGLLVPLTRTQSFADLAAKLGLAVLVVVGSRLGAINHALLTIRHVQACGLPFAGYVVNFPVAGTDVAARTNVDVLTSLAGAPLGVMPHVAGVQATEEGRHRLASAAAAHLRIDDLLVAL
jgi:dethiobiotin synthetase